MLSGGSRVAVVTFANSKGGSGKTTSALILACELAEHASVCLIDADPRRPVTTWATLPGKPDRLTVVTNASEKTILDEIDAASASNQFVIVDLEGTASRLTSYAISQSDLVVIPMKEQQQDALAAVDVIQELKRDMKAVRRTIPFAVLFTQTRVVAKSRTARFVSNQFRLNDATPVFATEIHDRDAYSALFSVGGGPRSLQSRDVNNLEAAVKNAAQFAAEVVTLLRSHGANQKRVA
jgi:chromosome partitioning protein